MLHAHMRRKRCIDVGLQDANQVRHKHETDARVSGNGYTRRSLAGDGDKLGSKALGPSLSPDDPERHVEVRGEGKRHASPTRHVDRHRQYGVVAAIQTITSSQQKRGTNEGGRKARDPAVEGVEPPVLGKLL